MLFLKAYNFFIKVESHDSGFAALPGETMANKVKIDIVFDKRRALVHGSHTGNKPFLIIYQHQMRFHAAVAVYRDNGNGNAVLFLCSHQQVAILFKQENRQVDIGFDINTFSRFGNQGKDRFSDIQFDPDISGK